MIEPIEAEFEIDGLLFKTQYPPRVKGGSVSYALGVWGRGKVPSNIEEVWDDLQMPDEERFAATLAVAHDAMNERRSRVLETTILLAGPEVVWVSRTSDGVRWLHCWLSVVLPDHIELEKFHHWLQEHSQFPENLINKELERIQHVRAAAHVFGA